MTDRPTSGARRIASLTTAAFLAACGPNPTPSVDGGSCPNDLPKQCPEVPPSYKTDVEPIIMSVCQACHTSAGVAASDPFITWDDIHDLRDSAQDQVLSCRMPIQPVRS